MSSRYIAAAKDGFTDVLREAQRKDLNQIDEDGLTATLWAARVGKLEALRMIVGRGGDVNKSDYMGYTALHHSAKMGHVDVVSYLINWGCNLFALDNDHHSAMDVASLYEKHEVVRHLDAACAQQQSKNPKIVAKLKEEAIKNADRNIKRYEKLQEEAERRAEKEQRKLENMNNDFKPPEKKSIFKTLTVKLRGGAKLKQGQSGRKFTDIAGLTYGGARTGVAKKVLQKKVTSNPLFDNASFKVSEIDESGKRTVRSMEGTQGIRGASAEVMYMTSRGEHSANEVSSSRPAVFEVFDPSAKSNLNKSYKSESDLLFDSGVDSYFSDHEDDEEERPGLLYRPGFGQTAFFRKINPAMTTLQSFEADDEGHGGMSNGIEGDGGSDEADMVNGRAGEADIIAARMQDLPWDQDDIENLDDDDEDNEFSSLEMFLMSAGLPAYISHFTKEKVDLELLMKITDNEMKEIGLPFGPRKKLLEALERRQKVLDRPADMTDSFL